MSARKKWVHTLHRFTWFAVAFACVLTISSGCGDNDAVLARVGQVEITRVEYEQFVSNLSPIKENVRRDAASQAGYLQAMVDRELLLLEATERGLYEDVEIQQELAFITRRRLSELYQVREIAPSIEVTEEDLQREFVDSRLNSERLLSRILVRSEADRDRVLSELAAGRSFAELVDEFAPNDAIAEGDGVVGWFNGSEAERRFLIPRRVFFTVGLDEVAPPVRLSRGWQIYRFLDERTPELATYQQEVYRLVRDRKWQAGNREEFEQLKHRYGVEVRAEAMGALIDALRKRRADKLDVATDGQVLFSLSEGQMTVGEGIDYLKAQGASGPPPDSVFAQRLFEDLLLRPLLFERVAQERGWNREDEFVGWHQQEKNKLILTALMARETVASQAFDEGEVHAFYEANKSRFVIPREVRIRELSASTLEDAEGFLQQLKDGTPIGRLLIRRDAETHGKPRTGEMALTPVFRSRYPVLFDAAFAAADGEWVGPIETKDGHFAVFQVLGRREEQIEPFDGARPRVEALLRQQNESELVGRFISRLREKYADRVVQFPDRLVADEES